MDYEAAQAHSGMHDYDPDNHFDSSSSSGGDHSSPSASDGSSPAYSAASQQEWALDLGLTMPWTAASPAALGGMAAMDSGFVASQPPAASGGAFKHAARNGQGGNGAANDGLALTGDFWSAAPGQEALSPAGSAGGGQQDRDGPQRATDYFGAHANRGKDKMQMEFDDMVHEDVCGCAASASNVAATGGSPCFRFAQPLNFDLTDSRAADSLVLATCLCARSAPASHGFCSRTFGSARLPPAAASAATATPLLDPCRPHRRQRWHRACTHQHGRIRDERHHDSLTSAFADVRNGSCINW